MNSATTFLSALGFPAAVAALFIVIGIIVERLRIVDKAATARGLLFNCAVIISLIAFDAAIGISITGWVVSCVNRLPIHGLISLDIPHHGKTVIAIACAWFNLFIIDFFYYRMHRAQHASKWLWAQHQLHHSDEHLNVSTALRGHWLETPLQALFISAPLALLFKLTPVNIVSAYLCLQIPRYFIHLNARISLGPLNRIIASPHTHRIHHSRNEQHWGKNFVSAFSFWDWIFGTYYHPAKDEWPETGIPSKPSPSFADAMLDPFASWAKMIRVNLSKTGVIDGITGNQATALTATGRAKSQLLSQTMGRNHLVVER